MLSRTADSLYWLSRYLERADYLARVLDVAARLSALHGTDDEAANEWESALETAGCSEAFSQHYDRATAETVTEFLAFSDKNVSSIRQCIETARSNARAVRTAITSQMWESINSAWLELQDMDYASTGLAGRQRFLDWVKDVSLRFDGSAYRTMLRTEAFYFSRIGTFLERADNTARILDVKYHVLLPNTSQVGGGLDYSQWAAILRGVNSLTAYHWVYRDRLKPWLVAELLILRPEMPRSLRSCYRELVTNLDHLADLHGRQGQAQRSARGIVLRLDECRIEHLFDTGLHEFISKFLTENNLLGAAITEQYLV